MKSLPIDLHLEVSALRNYINSQLETRNPNLLYGKDYYEIFKRVVIDAEVKPFLTFPKDESENNYYEKYVRQSKEEFEKLIPDFSIMKVNFMIWIGYNMYIMNTQDQMTLKSSLS